MSIQYADLRLTEVAAHIQIKKAMLELIVSGVDLFVEKIKIGNISIALSVEQRWKRILKHFTKLRAFIGNVANELRIFEKRCNCILKHWKCVAFQRKFH